MIYTIILMPSAEKGFQNQYNYIAERSESGAVAWSDAFFDALLKLETRPQHCTLAPESVDHEEEIRQLLFKTRKGRTYRALFVIRGDTVLILHIRGPRQNLMRSDEIELPDE